MARLKLGPGTSLKEVGHAVFDAAAAFYNQGGRSDPTLHSAIETCFAKAGNQINFHFHYDRTYTDPNSGSLVTDVHIVIPDFAGRVRDPDKPLEDFDLSDIAAESMGYVVIMGCGD